MFFSKKKSVLGIDIGTSNIKIVQVSHEQKPFLETYGIVNSPYQIISGKSGQDVIEHVAEILKNLMDKAKVSTKKCVISFPNNAVFTSVIEMPTMSEKELASSVEFEAKKYVPLALSEIDLSWSVIGKTAGGSKVLLTAVPKQITNNYMKIFDLAGLDPYGGGMVGEIEALALIRALVGNAVLNCVIIDIGAKATGLNIIENGLLRLSRNLSIGGDTITMKIAETLNITPQRAEQFKKDFGVSGGSFIPESIKPVLNLIKNEVKQLLTIYHSHNIQVDKVLLVGGGSNIPGIVDFFKDLDIPIELGNPLQTVGYSQEIAPILKRYSLNLPIAIGLALRNES
jgi:type IV pilus assembly protein PilM